MSTPIGSVTDEDLHAEAARRPGTSERWTHPRLRAVSEDLARTDGGLVVASGGTTGAPKLTVLAPHLGVPRVHAHWRPLGPGDVLLNLFTPGRLWGAHYFYNAFAAHSRATAVPMGALNAREFHEWADVIGGLGVTALAGAPNVLARFAETVTEAGLTLPVRAVIWSGEPLTAARTAPLHAAFPRAGLWGNYGSIETFVIGVSRPGCRPGALHLLPGQRLEPDDDGALLTRTGDGWPVPAWRFRVGDRVRATTCPCGDGDAFEVLGRADDAFKLFGGMARTSDVLRNAAAIDGVTDAQLVLYRDPAVPAAVVGMRLRYTGPATDAARVRHLLVHSIEDLEICARHTPEAILVDHVTDLERNPRTQKVVPVLWHDAADLATMAGATA